MTQTEEKLTKGKRPDVLNLNESMVNSLIKKVEQTIHAAKEQQLAMQDELKAAEELYMPLRKKYDDLEVSIQEETITLQTLVGIKKNERGEARHVHVLRSVSNEVVKDKRKRVVRCSWIKEGIAVLKKEDKFLSFDTILRKIIDTHPEYDLVLKNYSNQTEASARGITRNSFIRAADPSIRKDTKLVMYNDKFGLPEFCDKHRRPKPEYIQSTLQPVNKAV